MNPIVASLIAAILTSNLVSTQAAVIRLLDQASRDKLGAFFNDFKAQWNLEFPAFPITETDYDPTDYAAPAK